MSDAGAGAAGVNEPPIGIVIGEQQGPEKGPRAFRIGPADHHELLAVQAFDFQPQAAVAGCVGRIGLLRDDPFELQTAGLLIEGTPASDLVIAELQGEGTPDRAARGDAPSAP